MMRAWYWPETAIRPPLAALSTLTGACCDKNATSSSKVLLEGGGEGEGMVGFAALLGAVGDWHASANTLRQGSNAL